LAEAVTHSGQLAIRWAEKAVNQYFNEILGTSEVDYVVYIDTDSVYVNAEPIVQKFMPNATDKTKIVDKLDLFFEKKVKLVIANAYNHLYDYMNHREQLMFMDREVIADASVFCAKKHYFMRVHDSEGIRYHDPKIKIMGMGFIKSNIPELCRIKCREMVPIALEGTNEEFVKEIEAFREVFEAAPLEEIACVTGVSNIRKYLLRDGQYKDSTPIGSKSAIIYNRLHERHNLGSKAEKAQEGSKIRYVYLKKANPIQENTVGFVDFLPPEFGLQPHVDKRAQFEKTFMGPLNEILTALKWERKIVSNLFGFFGQ
jgi:DNA polymerase elongation subunit (family B)